MLRYLVEEDVVGREKSVAYILTNAKWKIFGKREARENRKVMLVKVLRSLRVHIAGAGNDL